ncbi:MAG: hypothetical protein K9L62_02900 [Vallitaleaceae bacterium]|nr:hypothetical protein [Vallitaleaceae bacterium]
MRSKTKIDENDFKAGCPMTKRNCEKYSMNDSMAKRWCNDGCSVDCGKLLFEKLSKRGRKLDGEIQNTNSQRKCGANMLV